MFSLIFFSFFFLFIALSMTCRAAPPFIAASSTYCFWFSLSCFLFSSSFDYYDFPYASFRFVYHILWVFYCLMRRSLGRKFLNKRMSPTIRLSTQFKRIQDKQKNNQRKRNKSQNQHHCRVFLLTTVVFNGQRVTSYRSILQRET